jgi:hypothetical protein
MLDPTSCLIYADWDRHAMDDDEDEEENRVPPPLPSHVKGDGVNGA